MDLATLICNCWSACSLRSKRSMQTPWNSSRPITTTITQRLGSWPNPCSEYHQTITTRSQTAGLDLAKLEKLRSQNKPSHCISLVVIQSNEIFPAWFNDVNQDITTADPPVSKPQLYCDSTFIEYKAPSDPAPTDKKKTILELYGNKIFR